MSNTKTSEQPAPSKNTCWRAQHHRGRPSFPWGTKHRGTQKPWSNQLQGKTPAGERSIIDAAPTSLGGRNPEEHKNLGATSSKEKQPLASAASSTPPQLPLGDKTLRNKKTSGQPSPRKNTRWRARHHRRHPSFPWGMKPQGTRTNTRLQARYHLRFSSFPWGMNPPQKKRQRPISKGAAETTKKSFPWGTKPQVQQKRQHPNFKGAVEQRRQKQQHQG